ncbi:unnamed protein product [Trifolium pratense]|uniref:Uncharacterized protein n=1 Tax=Trifolium pratense TaxID=57577 RepID=A0ACB0LDY8_TRIPR|nr:unnamed protein product [Trifolium pratense]
MGMDRVQVVQAKREATQTARRNLCLTRRKERSSHVITLVHFISRWFSSTSVFSAAHLAYSRLGCVDGKKSQIIQRLNKYYSSIVG